MNSEEMISYIKKRPGMYVGELRLSNIEQFIKGFMFNNVIMNRVEEVDVFSK